MRPLKEGGTQADALKQYRKATGKDHPDAVPPCEMPDSLGYLYRWFWEISTGRGIGGMGTPMPLAPSEIVAWCGLRQVVLEEWELTTLQGLDTAFLKVARKSNE